MTGVRWRQQKIALLATDRYRLALREITWRRTTPTHMQALHPANTMGRHAKTLACSGDVTLALSRGGTGRGHVRLRRGTRRTTNPACSPSCAPEGPLALPGPARRPARVAASALAEVVSACRLVYERTTRGPHALLQDRPHLDSGGTETPSRRKRGRHLHASRCRSAFNPH